MIIMRIFFKHLKGMDFGGKMSCSIITLGMKRENCFVIWKSFAIGGHSVLLNTYSPALDPNIVRELKVWPMCTPLDDPP